MTIATTPQDKVAHEIKYAQVRSMMTMSTNIQISSTKITMSTHQCEN
jgi:hypothetical protein